MPSYPGFIGFEVTQGHTGECCRLLGSILNLCLCGISYVLLLYVLMVLRISQKHTCHWIGYDNFSLCANVCVQGILAYTDVPCVPQIRPLDDPDQDKMYQLLKMNE